MKRVILMAVACLFATVVAAQAQERQDPSKTPSATAAVRASTLFSKASIEKSVAVRAAVARSFATPAPPVPRTSKPFFKTPWPYIIGAAVAVGVVVAVNHSGSSNGTGTGY